MRVAEEIGILFAEASAQTGQNVDEAVKAVCEKTFDCNPDELVRALDFRFDRGCLLM